MSAGLIATRYAKALFRLCDGKPESAQRQIPSLNAIEELFATDAGKVLRSPVMPMDLKKELLAYAQKVADSDKLFNAFIDTMAEAGRISVLPDVVVAFRELLMAAEGVVPADLVTASAIDKAQVDEICEMMGQVLGKKVQMEDEVDESLVGGFIVKVGNYRVDMSLKSRIEELASNAAKV